jgi:hypothetical protein
MLSGCATRHKVKCYRMTTPLHPGMASPDRVEACLGTLTFLNGFPEPFP